MSGPTHEPYRLLDGWYCMIDGIQHGPWELKEYAQAGFETEQRRATARAEKEKTHGKA